MIVPTKGIGAERALLSVGAQICIVATEPMTVSGLWKGLQDWRRKHEHDSPVTFAWFALALDMLYALRVIEYEGGLVRRVGSN